jgi:hypothetical protein
LELLEVLIGIKMRGQAQLLIFHWHAGHWKISILVFIPPPRAITNLPLGRLSAIQAED